jgi:AAA domain
MPDRVDNFIAALQDEIVSSRERKKGMTKLYDGRLVSQIGENWIYEFTAVRICANEDDTPGKLEVNGQRIDCSLVTTKGLQLQIAVQKFLGEIVPSARLSYNHTEILERLIERFDETSDKRTELFSLAEDVFAGVSKPISMAGVLPHYSFQSVNAPNQSQALAIENSFYNSLAVIWGPPGTGKTRTIARAVEAHLNAGRRVLLLSHANTAVDAALEDIASQLEDTFYRQGKIVRYGVPKDFSLQNRYPLVMPDNLIAAAHERLKEQRGTARKEIGALESQIAELQEFNRTCERVRQLEQKIQRPKNTSSAQRNYDQVLKEIAVERSNLSRMSSNAVADYSPSVQLRSKELRILIFNREQLASELSFKLARELTTAEDQSELDTAYRRLDELMDSTGINPNDIKSLIAIATKRLHAAQNTLNNIPSKSTLDSKMVLANAKVVGATLSKLFTSSVFKDEMFDIAIVDEASMVPLPHLYWALGKISKGVTLVGDFKQLPPIVTATTKSARKWLGENIFDELNIATVEESSSSHLVSMLDTQFRMAPEIASVSSEMFYGGLLKNAQSTNKLGFYDSVFADKRIVVIDTSEVNPWCTIPPGGSRTNLYSAGVAVKLCERLLKEHADITVGVATAYRPQAQLIAKAIEDLGLRDRTAISTVHRFQGSESSVMIFDCVDGKGSKKSMLDERVEDHTTQKSIADVLLNVALTRARALFILIVNKQYFLETNKDGLLCQFIDKLSLNALTLNSLNIDGSYVAGDLEDLYKNESTSSGNPVDCSPTKSVFNENNFWSTFQTDLENAEKSVCIVSPFLTMKRSQRFFDQFKNLIARQKRLTIFTRPIEEHKQDHMKRDSEDVIAQLRSFGATVVETPKIHQKVVIIDDTICWEGSLNILSHCNSLEHMRRLEGNLVCKEVRDNLRLLATSL